MKSAYTRRRLTIKLSITFNKENFAEDSNIYTKKTAIKSVCKSTYVYHNIPYNSLPNSSTQFTIFLLPLIIFPFLYLIIILSLLLHSSHKFYSAVLILVLSRYYSFVFLVLDIFLIALQGSVYSILNLASLRLSFSFFLITNFVCDNSFQLLNIQYSTSISAVFDVVFVLFQLFA